MAALAAGEAIVAQAGDRQSSAGTGNFELLVLGGLPIREPISRYGPFVMNTRAEIIQAVEDYQSGRLGQIPAIWAPPPHAGVADESDVTS